MIKVSIFYVISLHIIMLFIIFIALINNEHIKIVNITYMMNFNCYGRYGQKRN